ncbi:hypothetical protein DFJ73DRAFT_761910 [Zopfochytrium polystomum]|nr:hypothetical protein DFJ73DRAFT_761910 [Zopfochytrium polystomum]
MCHDNDFSDIAKVLVIPTYDEIMADATPEPPGNFQTVLEAHWMPFGPRRLIDTHFRLLREDMLHGQRRVSASSAIDVNIFDRLSVRVVFQPPHQLKGRTAKARREFWTLSDRLMVSGLVALVLEGSKAEGLVVVLGTVMERDVNKLTADNAEVLDHRADGVGRFYMVEAKKIMFESYRPILKALQTLMPESLPFMSAQKVPGSASTARPARHDGKTMEVAPALYAQVPDFRLDLTNPLNKRRADDAGTKLWLDPKDATSRRDAVKELARNSRMDTSQAESLVGAVSSELSCIQGVPSFIFQLFSLQQNHLNPYHLTYLHRTTVLKGQLMDAGYKNVARLGGRSQDESIQAVTWRRKNQSECSGSACWKGG